MDEFVCVIHYSVYLHYCIQEVLTLPYLKYLIEDNSRDYSIYRLMSSCHSVLVLIIGQKYL